MARIMLIAALCVVAFSVALAGCSTTAAVATETTEATGAKKATRTTKTPGTTTTASTLAIETWTALSFEQNHPGLSYSGAWTFSSATDASKGGFVFADKEGAAVTFRFVGNYFGWLAKTSDKYGKATVTVDDGSPVTVDLYSKDTMWRHLVWETKDLDFGEHTVKIEWTGKKRTAAKGTCVNVDAIEVVGALTGRYQQTDKRFDYEGTWKTNKTASASGGGYTLTKRSRSSVTVTFTGIQLDWYAKTGPPYGKARVIVDDNDPVTVDLHSADEQWKQLVWSSGRLEMGTHVITIKWTGLKDSDATDTYINVDSFEIAGLVK